MPKFEGLDRSGLLIGTIILLSDNYSLPFGTLPCTGATVSRTSYSNLFRRIGTTWGTGDSSTTFHLPQLSGHFPRFVDSVGGNDPDRLSRTPMFVGTFNLPTCSTVSGSPVVTVPSTVNLAVGKGVTGTNIPANSTVMSIVSATTFQLGNQSGSAAVNASGTGSGITLTFQSAVSGPFAGTYQTHGFSTHNHGGGAHSHTTSHNGKDAPGGTSNVFLTAGGGFNQTYSYGSSSSGTIISTEGGNETRPKNVMLVPAIVYI